MLSTTPTKDERAIAEAQVEGAAAAIAVLERRLEKTALRAPADGVVSVIVAEVGENLTAGLRSFGWRFPDGSDNRRPALPQ
jgi:multidrug resistance efflux pump